MSRNSGPFPSCVGECKKYQVKRPLKGRRYELGQKRCQTRNQWLEYDGIRCPCCNYRLRTGARSRTTEKIVPRI
ncbi:MULTISPECIES: hypothetical protein [Nitrosopumilus]|uniref:hypothetical protein n=1 Tax=Nitrosopumilus TaxID=338191 RepID=UPI00037F596D|nr:MULTISPECIES: hypothetical protein [Nitrosopumilus]